MTKRTFKDKQEAGNFFTELANYVKELENSKDEDDNQIAKLIKQEFKKAVETVTTNWSKKNG